MCNYALSSSLEWSSSSPAALSKEGGRGRDLLTEDSVPTSHPQPPFTQLEIEFYFKSQTVAELLPDRIIAAGMRMIKIDLSNSRQSEGFHLQSQASCCEESSIKAGVGANFFSLVGPNEKLAAKHNCLICLTNLACQLLNRFHSFHLESVFAATLNIFLSSGWIFFLLNANIFKVLYNVNYMRFQASWYLNRY